MSSSIPHSSSGAFRSSNNNSSNNNGPPPLTAFEAQREELLREIAMGMESVLQNINRLNRNLESIIAVGNEFSSVEALWSQFENFMGKSEGEIISGNGNLAGNNSNNNNNDNHEQTAGDEEEQHHDEHEA